MIACTVGSCEDMCLTMYLRVHIVKHKASRVGIVAEGSSAEK